ncbi:MAG: CbtB domain-containing protein [Candidatus Methylumidiphilus sp.]
MFDTMQNDTARDALTIAPITEASASHVAPAMGIAALGLTLVLFTALAPVQAVHSAAHDTRHGFSVPCH